MNCDYWIESDGDLWHNTPEDFAESFIADGNLELCETFDDLPNELHGSRRVYLKMDAKCAAESIFEEWATDEYRWEFRNTIGRYEQTKISADCFIDFRLECLFFDLDDEYIPEKQFKGIPDLQKAFDRFLLLNRVWWGLMGDCPWFNPGRHSLGLRGLQSALDKAVKANEDWCYVLYKDPKDVYQLDKKFWLEMLADGLRGEPVELAEVVERLFGEKGAIA
jgi:hypothetical protein